MTPPRSKKTALMLICFSWWSSYPLRQSQASWLLFLQQAFPLLPLAQAFQSWLSALVWVPARQPVLAHAQAEAPPTAGVPSFPVRTLLVHFASSALPFPAAGVGAVWLADSAGTAHCSGSICVHRFPA